MASRNGIAHLCSNNRIAADEFGSSASARSSTSSSEISSSSSSTSSVNASFDSAGSVLELDADGVPVRVLGHEDEVEDPDRALVDQVAERRDDLTGELVAWELHEQELHRAELCHLVVLGFGARLTSRARMRSLSRSSPGRGITPGAPSIQARSSST